MNLPRIVGIVNLSPESNNNKSDNLLDLAGQLITEGADILDIGAQSSRPGVAQLEEHEEIKRISGAVAQLKTHYPNIPLSVDTTRKEVLRVALSEGATIANDISGGRYDKELLKLVGTAQCQYVIMHSQGNFSNLHKTYLYNNLVDEIKQYFSTQSSQALHSGISPHQIILDPGIGFSKSGEQNLLILKSLSAFKSLGYPIYISLSRKKFLTHLLGATDTETMDYAANLLHCLCLESVAYIRTHNVKQLRQCLTVYAAYKSTKMK